MKKIPCLYLCLAAIGILIFFSMQSCDYFNLNAKERSAKGYWGQNLLVAQLQYEMKGDKSFEAYLSSGLFDGGLVQFKGTWKVEDDRLVTELTDGPNIRSKNTESNLSNALKELGVGEMKIAASGKIAEANAEEMQVEVDGKKMTWKKENGTKFKEMKKKFDSWEH